MNKEEATRSQLLVWAPGGTGVKAPRSSGTICVWKADQSEFRHVGASGW